MRALPLSLALLTLSFASPVMAQNNPVPYSATLPAGQAILNIAATERTQIQQDLLVASLRIEKENVDAKIVQNEINALMKKAVDHAKLQTAVKTSTGQYYIYQNDPNPNPLEKGTTPLPKTWRGSQTIELQSTAADTLLKLVGELQDTGLIVSGLNYTLSPAKADAAKDDLMEKALAKVATRAERAAKAMGKTQMALIEVNVDTSDNINTPYAMRAMAMDGGRMEKMATPVAEPGESEITLTVSAKALLKP